MPDEDPRSLIPIKRANVSRTAPPSPFSDEQFWQPLNAFLGQFRSFVDMLAGGRPVTWRDSPDAMVAEIGLPGLTRGDIEIQVDDLLRRVTVVGKSRTGRAGAYLEQTFQQSFTVDQTLRLEQARAKLENGMLRIAFPKARRQAGRTINID